MLVTNYILNSVWGSSPSAPINLVRVRDQEPQFEPKFEKIPECGYLETDKMMPILLTGNQVD